MISANPGFLKGDFMKSLFVSVFLLCAGVYAAQDHEMRIDRDGAPRSPENSPQQSCTTSQQRRMAFVQWLDRDGDRRIALTEFPGAEAYFTFLDRNKDGYISVQEVPKHPLFSPGTLADACAP